MRTTDINIVQFYLVKIFYLVSYSLSGQCKMMC